MKTFRMKAHAAIIGYEKASTQADAIANRANGSIYKREFILAEECAPEEAAQWEQKWRTDFYEEAPL